MNNESIDLITLINNSQIITCDSDRSNTISDIKNNRMLLNIADAHRDRIF